MVQTHIIPRSEFERGTVHLTFTVDKVASEQGFLLVIQFTAISIISPMLHTHLHLILERQADEAK
jgi:hypothetical protein